MRLRSVLSAKASKPRWKNYFAAESGAAISEYARKLAYSETIILLHSAFNLNSVDFHTAFYKSIKSAVVKFICSTL